MKDAFDNPNFADGREARYFSSEIDRSFMDKWLDLVGDEARVDEEFVVAEQRFVEKRERYNEVQRRAAEVAASERQRRTFAGRVEPARQGDFIRGGI